MRMDRALKARMAVTGVSLSLFLMWSTPGMAYTPMMTGQGIPISWRKTPDLEFVGNPSNRSGISSTLFQQAIVKGLQRWKAASNDLIQFDYWQGTDSNEYKTVVKQDGVSRIFFASQASGNTGVGPGILGITQIWYNTTSGEILENDIILNDIQYKFHNDPKTSGRDHAYYIENVITHELGHALGLSHSGVQLASMIYTEAPEQNHLHCDDQAGIRALYPTPGQPETSGSIQGQLLQEDTHRAVLGIHVVAVSLQRGTIAASALTDHEGGFNILGLEPGEYLLYAEPFFAGAAPLTEYYSVLHHHLCNGGYFARTWIANVSVVGGKTSSLPQWKPFRCTGGGAAFEAASEYSPLQFSEWGTFGTVNRFPPSQTLTYSLPAFEGRLELHAITHSAYSPTLVEIKVKNSQGEGIKNAISSSLSSFESGFELKDRTWSSSESLPKDDYTIELTAQVSGAKYLGEQTSVDPVRFVILTGTKNPASSPNPRCQMNENFPTYQAATSAPPQDTSDDEANSGFCGQIQSPGGGPLSGPPRAGVLLSWFLPWIVMLGSVRLRWKQSPAKLEP